ncbi:MAG: 3-methyl-2-oxobutanoate hydroxymethyltransferase [Deltaproteobacteria bacterium]|nr:3-methyl-2-oxobutanoate hydroxymethyltransferase [Deltaproteobacteria bacterium]
MVGSKSKVTVRTLQEMKRSGERIAMVTAYDATMARIVEAGGVDVVLVGDSLGMVIQGLDTTLPVTLDEMIYHCRAVARGLKHAHLVGDLPFLSYQTGPEDAMRSAGRLLKEGGCESVKLEGGEEMAPTVARLVTVGIPVMGHVGLTPQSVHAMGGFRVQGKDDASAERILRGARALCDAGAYAVVLEGIPLTLAARVTAEISVPTIGIGAGPHCDGQVLVIHDLLGFFDELRPKFVKRYDELGERARSAVSAYVAEVRSGEFPTREHSFGAAPPRIAAPTPGSEPEPDPPRKAYGPTGC